MTSPPFYDSPQAFWTKIRTYATKMGRDLVFSALVLYYALQDPDLPGWARTKICGALGYLIFPADAIPDVWPGGYADDAAVIALALGAVAMHIDDGIMQRARDKLRQWFGPAADGATLVG